MPPRLRCLNPLRTIERNVSVLRASFSTAQVLADDRPHSTAADLLARLNDTSPSSPSISRSPTLSSRPSTLSSRPTPGNTRANAAVLRLIAQANEKAERARAVARSGTQLSTVQEMEKHKLAADLSRQISRRWKAGDVYAPHDLSAVEMAKWKSRGRPERDVFDVLALDPLEEYKNFSIMSEYMTPMGRIKHSKETGLRPVNQRRIAKAIRRSIGMGMMPSVHRHPEILQKMAVRVENNSPYRRGPL